MWAGRKILPGFKVDMRETLPDGSRNLNWRKYKRFDVYAIERLKAMFDNSVDQVEILKAFPDYSWKALTERMRYHSGKGWWKSYKGEKSTRA